MKKIDIIILHYGDIPITQNCIKSIESKAKHYRDIILINNDELIDIRKLIKPQRKRKVINAGSNLGFAAGVNLGIKKALANKADYICLVNNDVTTKKDFIGQLSTFLEGQRDAGIGGAIIEFEQEGMTKYDHGAYISRTTGTGRHHNNSEIVIKSPKIVDYVSGCCMMIKKEVFDAIGYFDERFFMYYEDVDFALRAKEKGYLAYVIPQAIVQHELSNAIGRKSARLVYQLVKSHIRFSKKHTEFPLRYFAVISQIIKFSLKMPYNINAVIKGMKEA